jgi:glutamyl-tRNA reductase
MNVIPPFYKHTEHFVVLGTNFTKADTLTRSRFAITKAMEMEVYKQAEASDFSDFFLLSTCNRTEFYTCGPLSALKKLVASQLEVTEDDFETYFYVLTGIDAVRHFFHVVSGLDSQIIGDYEIVCQVKAALDEARKHNLVGTITDRISNFAYQAQKKVKAHTNLSSGKYSVSYAAAELMFHEHETQDFKNILLIGTGDFGSTVARNLRHYFPHIHLTITNRTREKAEKLATQVKADVISFDSFRTELNRFDVVITSVGLDEYLIQPDEVTGSCKKLFLDLSVPQAVNPEVKQLEGIRLYSVDEVSAFHNELLQQRKLEIPRAQKIVEVYVTKLIEWQQVYSHRDIILSYKEKIKNFIYDHQATQADVAVVEQQRKIEKTFSALIQEIREQGYAGCRVIEAMNNLVPAEK